MALSGSCTQAEEDITVGRLHPCPSPFGPFSKHLLRGIDEDRVDILIRRIDNGWILEGMSSDRPIGFKASKYYKDIGTLLADVESFLIEAGFGE